MFGDYFTSDHKMMNRCQLQLRCIAGKWVRTRSVAA